MKPTDLDRDILEMLDGTLSPERTRALHDRLRVDAAARQRYYQHVRLHQSLAFRLARQDAGESAVVAFPAKPRRRARVISLVLTAAALIAAGLFLVPHGSRETPPFATLEAAPDTRFSIVDASGRPVTVRELTPGSRIAVDQGTLQVRYGDCAVRIPAPAEFELHHPPRLRLRSGTAFASIGRSSQGTVIETDLLRIEGRDCEFGIDALPQRPHRTEVLTGTVHVTATTGAGKSLALASGEACETTSSGGFIAATRVRRAFPGSLPSGLPDIHFPFDGSRGAALEVEGSHPEVARIRARYLNAHGVPTPPPLVTGRIGKAIALRGDGDHVVTDWGGFSGDIPRSMSFWAKVQPGTDLTHLPAIAGWGFPGDEASKWNVVLAHQTYAEPVVARLSLGQRAYDGGTPLTDGRWHQIVVVLDRPPTPTSDPAVAIYVDGRLEPLTPRNFGMDSARSVRPDTVTGTPQARPLCIGISVEFRAGSFKGMIDELRLHAGALSPETVIRMWREAGGE